MTNFGVKQISIRLLPDGFSFLNQFHPILPGADFNKRLQEAMLETIFKDEEESPIERCSIESVRFCISPIDLPESLTDQMYEVSLPSAEQDEIRIKLKDEANGILFTFGIDSELYHFILRNWPDITFTHPLFELYLQWIEREEAKENCMIAEAGENYINLLVFKDSKLQLANRFEDAGTNNILYHLMNCWSQCNLDVLDNKLHLISESKELRNKIQQYIKQCE